VLPIILPTRRIGLPPALALTMEGLEVVEVVMYDYHSYPRLFTEVWQKGTGFILVEDDVVPWPGALAELDGCDRECCGYEYPNAIIHEEPRSGWCASLGCTKFSQELTRRVPYDPEWQKRGWDSLDGAVFETLQREGVEMHVHSPPVAHAKAQKLASRAVEL